MKHSKSIAALLIIPLFTLLIFHPASASSANKTLAAGRIGAPTLLATGADGNNSKAQNTIIFWNNNEDPESINCNPGGGSGGGLNSAVGGSTEQQIYWCAFRQVYDELHTAAIFGNIVGEGAFNPVRWQYADRAGIHPQDGGPFTVSWDTLYNSN